MDPYRVQADLIKAMAHPTRLHLLDILAQGEACVCHLTTILGQRQPYVSQHLMVLREAGLVTDRKDGRDGLLSAGGRPAAGDPGPGARDFGRTGPAGDVAGYSHCARARLPLSPL